MIWFDLDNSPHVPLFRPFFVELNNRKEEYFVTARDFAQTKELLDLYNIEYLLIGKHGGKRKINKLINLFSRSFSLRKNVNDKDIKLAVSHGSRTQLLAAIQLGLNSLLMLDYEYTESKIFNALATKILMPVYIPEKRLYDAGFNLKKVIRYNGFKEELYLKDFEPDENFRKSIDIDHECILVIFRPPSMVGNYHNTKGEKLLNAGLKYFSSFQNTICLIVNRTPVEQKFIKEKFFDNKKIRFLDKAVDGLQLLFSADIAISGGGTMNRESSLLGTETYSIFSGKRPYLDEYLRDLGKLKFIDDEKDFEKIFVEKKNKTFIKSNYKNLVVEIIDLILSFI